MKKIMFALAAVLALVGTVFALGNREYRRTDFLMDTVVTVRARGFGARGAADAALARAREVEAQCSAYLDNSQVFRLNQTGSATLTGDALAVMEIAAAVWDKSGGAFDPAVKALVDLWDVNGGGRVPDAISVREALSCSGWDKVDFSPQTGKITLLHGAGVDLGGVAKGYAADVARDVLEQRGITSALIDFGGNIYALGKNGTSPWRVGLRDPDGNQGDYFGTVEVCDRAVVTSGAYERFFEQDGQIYHHILDPKTGAPAKSGLKSVTVIAPSSGLADALATAVYVMGADAGLELIAGLPDVEAVLMCEDGSVVATDGANFVENIPAR